MVERRRIPTDRIVARRAIPQSKSRAGGGMHRIVRLLPGGQMALRIAAIALRNRQVVIVIDVAGDARNVGMPVGQQKSSGTVIELGVQPCIERVALRAVRRGKERARLSVIRICRAQKIGQMAGRASRGKTEVLSRRRIFVALIALHRGVRSQQWKPVEMLLDCLHGNLPAKNRVTLGAVRAQLPAMDIRMTIRAVFAHIRENRLQVAFRAIRLRVHSTQRVARRVMIEFGDRSNRCPVRIGVAVFAGNGKRSVGTPAWLPLSKTRASGHETERDEHKRTPDLNRSFDD